MSRTIKNEELVERVNLAMKEIRQELKRLAKAKVIPDVKYTVNKELKPNHIDLIVRVDAEALGEGAARKAASQLHKLLSSFITDGRIWLKVRPHLKGKFEASYPSYFSH